MIEDDRVKHKERSFDKGDPHMPPKDSTILTFTYTLQLKNEMEDDTNHSKDEKGYGYVVDVSEEADVCIIWLEISWSIIV